MSAFAYYSRRERFNQLRKKAKVTIQSDRVLSQLSHKLNSMNITFL